MVSLYGILWDRIYTFKVNLNLAFSFFYVSSNLHSFFFETFKKIIRKLLRNCSHGKIKSPDNTFCFFAQCVDAVGFCLFLKTYLEVDNFPADFCERLFRYFQRVDQDEPVKSPLPRGGELF